MNAAGIVVINCWRLVDDENLLGARRQDTENRTVSWLESVLRMLALGV